ncbi:MAG TPA: copper resistance protein CopC, partial [Solirubrobacteraceae bacterium]
MRRLAALVTMAVSLLVPAAAGAHTHLEDLRPEPEAVLPRPPDAVRLTFNQPVDVIRAGIRNAAVDVLRRAGGRTLVLRPRLPLPAGRADVRFRVLSKDGHVLRGRYGFVVKRGAVGSGALELSEGGTSTRATVIHGLHHLLFVLAVGLVVVGPFVLPAALPAGALRAICVLGALAALGYAAQLPGGFGDTSAGGGWLLRAGLWLVAAVAVPRALLAGAALAGVALSLAINGHAGSFGGAGSVAVDTVHLLAAGTWLGGLVALALARGGADAVSAYARVALPAFALLVVSGALNGVLRVAGVDALVDTSYGRLVVAKAVIAAALAAIALTVLRRRRVPL